MAAMANAEKLAVVLRETIVGTVRRDGPDLSARQFACFLIAPLEAQQDADAEPAWDLELARRAAEIRSGNAEGKPASQVFAKIRERFS